MVDDTHMSNLVLFSYLCISEPRRSIHQLEKMGAFADPDLFTDFDAMEGIFPTKIVENFIDLAVDF